MNCQASCRIIIVLIFSCIKFILGLHVATANGQNRQTDPGWLPDTIVIIHQITLSGNAITKQEVVLRELEFRVNDTLSLAHFSQMLIISQQNVFNTRLFNFVTIDTSFVAGSELLDIRIALVERWYVWPIPFLEISDRNFNVWWETRDFSRLTYGVDFTFFNARGRNETLRIMTHFGFNQKYGFAYKIPFINKRQTLGVGFGAAIELNHELPVYTIDNQPAYIRNNATLLKKQISGFAELTCRPDFFTTHTFRLAYSWNDFDSAVSNIPGFVLVQNNVQQFASFGYIFRNDHRDVQYYPLKGYCVDVELNHSVPYETAHNSYLRTNLRIYRQLLNRWYWASGFTGKLSFEKSQPYYLQRGLGYGKDLVRSYEYYVVDGQHYALLKNNLKFALLPYRVEKIGFINTSKFNTIPLALYINAFIDMGYVYHYNLEESGNLNYGNTLKNSLLIGYGLGLDFTTYYDFVIRIAVGLNRMHEVGIYLHFSAPI